METPVTLHQYLKESTRPNHSAAESHPFQSALANARLSREAYADYLQQLRALHKGFEAKLALAAERDANVGSVVRPEHYQVRFLDNDLRALKVGNGEPLDCVKRFVDATQFNLEPVSLLGVLYVLLGSKHGGRFIAHNVQQAYEFTDAGHTYFNPYGEAFRELWQQFTAGLNALELTEAQRQAVLHGASATFDVFGEIGQEVWNRTEAGVVRG